MDIYNSKILVVDDEQRWADKIAALLREQGYQSVRVSYGITKFADLLDDYDLAVLDIQLKVARFIEEMGMTPVILVEHTNIGRTVIEKFEQNTDVSFAVVVLTPDDTASWRGGDAKARLRARQNVILELGYFLAKLGREKVCALHKAQVEIPSDLHGLLYIPMDNGEGWKMRIAKEMKKAGIPAGLSL